MKRAGAEQAAGDGGEDQGEVAGAEVARHREEVGGGALVQRGREFATVVEQLADEAE